jgi:uncharacterized phage protein (TIGR02220 family)
MKKDPAFLFYPQDFLVGTMSMSFEDKGRYITLLSLMHQQGRMSEETIRFIVGSFSVNLKSKFCVDENGLFYNERLENEIEKRKKFTESRRINGSKGGRKKNSETTRLASAKPSENLIENENVIVNIIEYLNNKTGKNFKKNSRKTISLISSRLKDGYLLDDFKTVIDKKCKSWLNDNEMDMYLRPETLFGTKFESYLNEKKLQKSKGGFI